MSGRQECEEYRESIVAHVMGELDPPAIDRLTHHLKHCAQCRGFHDDLVNEESVVRCDFVALSGPAESLAQQTVERIESLEAGKTSSRAHTMPPPKKGTRLMKRSYIFVSAAASIAVIAGVLWAFLGDAGTRVVFADAVAHLRHLESFACDTWLQITSDKSQRVQIAHVIVQGKRGRVEHYDEEGELSYVRIISGDRKSHLNPSTKKARQGKMEGEPPWIALERIAGLADEEPDIDLGEQNKNGFNLRGFKKTLKNGTGESFVFTVWVNTQTKMPHSVRVDFDRGGVAMAMGFDNMQWDRSFDERLFDIPENYTPCTKPEYPRDGQTLRARRLKEGVTLSLRTEVDGGDEIVETDIEWVALHTGESDVALLIRLNDEAWERFRSADPWMLNIDGQVRSNVHVDPLFKDFRHKLVVFDATSVTETVDGFLAPVTDSWTVTAE